MSTPYTIIDDKLCVNGMPFLDLTCTEDVQKFAAIAPDHPELFNALNEVTFDHEVCPQCGGKFKPMAGDAHIHQGYCSACLTHLTLHVASGRIYDAKGTTGYRYLTNPLLGSLSNHAARLVRKYLEV